MSSRKPKKVLRVYLNKDFVRLVDAIQSKQHYRTRTAAIQFLLMSGILNFPDMLTDAQKRLLAKFPQMLADLDFDAFVRGSPGRVRL